MLMGLKLGGRWQWGSTCTPTPTSQLTPDTVAEV